LFARRESDANGGIVSGESLERVPEHEDQGRFGDDEAPQLVTVGDAISEAMVAKLMSLNTRSRGAGGAVFGFEAEAGGEAEATHAGENPGGEMFM